MGWGSWLLIGLGLFVILLGIVWPGFIAQWRTEVEERDEEARWQRMRDSDYRGDKSRSVS